MIVCYTCTLLKLKYWVAKCHFTEFTLASLSPLPMKPQLASLFILSIIAGPAIAQTGDFVSEADHFLSVEVPKMEAAVARKDRAYFSLGLERMKAFVAIHGAQLETSRPCTEAVSDYLIVGLCRLSPPGSICEPTTFIPRFEANLAKCHAAAASKPVAIGVGDSEPPQ
jgi:hypothetical protein